MSLVGVPAEVVAATDPGLVGRRAEVSLETARTFVLIEAGRRVVVQKRGTVLRLENGVTVLGDECMGRLEERMKEARRS
jgi:RNase P/RNase MRP subunit p29